VWLDRGPNCLPHTQLLTDFSRCFPKIFFFFLNPFLLTQKLKEGKPRKPRGCRPHQRLSLPIVIRKPRCLLVHKTPTLENDPGPSAVVFFSRAFTMKVHSCFSFTTFLPRGFQRCGNRFSSFSLEDNRGKRTTHWPL